MGNITFRVPEELEEAVRMKLRGSKYTNRSELLRDLLRRWLNSVPVEISFLHDMEKG